MLLDGFTAQLEHSKRLRRFNVRSAREEFIRYTDSESVKGGPAALRGYFGPLGHVIRRAVSATGLLR